MNRFGRSHVAIVPATPIREAVDAALPRAASPGRAAMLILRLPGCRGEQLASPSASWRLLPT